MSFKLKNDLIMFKFIYDSREKMYFKDHRKDTLILLYIFLQFPFL